MNLISLPNVIIAGAPKCGTSSLYFWLSSHPEVKASPVKETFYFADEVNRFNKNANVIDHPIEKYYSYFSSTSSKESSIKLEATAPYIYYENALKHIPALPSKPKVIFILREPSARLYSQYRFERFRTKRIVTSWENYSKDVALKLHGDYEYYLKKWLHALGRDRIYVCTFESLVQNTESCVSDIAQFLDIDSDFYVNHEFIQHNETVAVRSKVLHRLGLFFQRYIPHWIQEKFLPFYLALNSGRMPLKDPNDIKIINELKIEYKDSVGRLKLLFPDLNLESWE
ncbi:MAG: Uncharacterised protein [Owenweeksia sp. TMED14]|nr:MAG: Uncharacterised protein [Owenweeksia sp. TMED14]|tara:strand:- start:1347 stop:2198 length:852 start_codon:yes stop_codon:yes gene_type:complete